MQNRAATSDHGRNVRAQVVSAGRCPCFLHDWNACCGSDTLRSGDSSQATDQSGPPGKRGERLQKNPGSLALQGYRTRLLITLKRPHMARGRGTIVVPDGANCLVKAHNLSDPDFTQLFPEFRSPQQRCPALLQHVLLWQGRLQCHLDSSNVSPGHVLFAGACWILALC